MNPNAGLPGTDQHSNFFITLNRSVQAAGEELVGAAAGITMGSMGGSVCAVTGRLIGAGLGTLVADSQDSAATGGKRIVRRKRVCVPGVWVS